MARVSVVIPVYNVEPYLRECLDSAVGQTLEDTEIICVNDGSTDGSGVIVREYADRDSRIVVLEQENRGLSAARNAGASHATGEYLYFMDSDDHLDLNALQALYERASLDDLDVLYFDAAPFFESPEIELRHQDYKSYYRRTSDYPGVLKGQELLAAMGDDCDWRPSVCLQFIRTEYFRTTGLSFYEGILHEDNLFSFLCVLQADRVGYLAQPYFHRRVREDSIMTVGKDTANFRGFFISYLEMLRFALQREFDERTSAAVAKLASEVYRQALKVYCGLPKQEREAIATGDASPEGLVTLSLIRSEAREVLKARKLERELDKRTAKLDQIRASRSYRIASALRRIPGLGK